MNYERIVSVMDNPFDGLSIKEAQRMMVYLTYIVEPAMTVVEVIDKLGCVLAEKIGLPSFKQ